MICPKCKTKNIKKANFCIDCGYEFTEEEQELFRKLLLRAIQNMGESPCRQKKEETDT